MNYWNKKEDLKIKAAAHTEAMETYAADTKFSVENTKIYDSTITFFNHDTEHQPSVSFMNVGTVEAIGETVNTGKIAVLNFASFKNPGGKFLEGSSAQEECLCHASNLYNILSQFGDFYKENARDTNQCLYRNRGLYIPEVVFITPQGQRKADVITVAAPNYKAASRYYYVPKSVNEDYLLDRIEFIKSIAEANNVNTLILGAYGCGVFGQNPKEVAEDFNKVFTYSTVDNIIYAVPGSDTNAKIFCQYFDNEDYLII